MDEKNNTNKEAPQEQKKSSAKEEHTVNTDFAQQASAGQEHTVNTDFAEQASAGQEHTVNTDFAEQASAGQQVEEGIPPPPPQPQFQKMGLVQKAIEQTYKVYGEIARGGMGSIYRIFDKNLYRDLAMKVLQIKNLPQEKKERSFEEFVEEARITAQLEHPNIVPVHDIGLIAGDNVYFTMKMVEGEELISIIRKLEKGEPGYRQKYNLNNLLVIFRKVCDAVAFAHSRGVVHRDIKPINIMVGRYGEVLVMDWGIAKFVGVSGKRETKKFYASVKEEKEGRILGTPAYMAPEQAFGHVSQVDIRTDVYLLGATLYCMVFFRPPHSGNDLVEKLLSSQANGFISPHEFPASQQLPTELCRIILKSMATKKEDRYQNVNELTIDIDNLMFGHITSTPVTFKAGEFLIREGEEGTEAYSIFKGKVEVFQNIGGKNVFLTSMGAGNIVGEMGLISHTKRSAHVVAKEDTEALVIDKKLFDQVLAKMPTWMEKIISTLVGRLQMANSKVHPLKVGDPVYHVLNHLGMLANIIASRSAASSMENFNMDFTVIVKEIATTLSIEAERTAEILSNLIETGEVCEYTEQGQFRFKNFYLFCHVLEFIRGVLEIERAIDWLGELPTVDKDTNILRCQIAAKLSDETRNFLLNVPMYAKFIE